MTAPVITTERLVLRMPEASDEPHFCAFLMSDRAKYVGGPATRGRAWRAFAHLVGQWEMRGYGVLVIERQDTGAVIGSCGFFHPAELDEPEISWSIWDESAEGQGFALEAALASCMSLYKPVPVRDGDGKVVGAVYPNDLAKASLQTDAA